MFLPGIEPGTFRVWGERDNRYTTETVYENGGFWLTQQRLTRTKNKSGSRCDQNALNVTLCGQVKGLLFLSGIEPETFRV